MKSKKSLGALGYFPLIWFLFFLVAPMFIVFLISFQKRGTYGGIDWVWSFDNYIRAFDSIYIEIFFKSFSLSSFTTLICLILAYPIAWALVTLPENLRKISLILIAIPFLTNFLIRVYAIKVFTGFDGPLIQFLNFFGLDADPFYLSQNIFLVMYGMVTTYLPFLIFPLYVAMDRMNFSLIEASQDLGGGHFRTFFNVIVPITWPAALTGANLVFIPCLGEYLIPDLLGGARSMLMGNLITEQFLKARDWAFGSALAMVLIFLLIFFLLIMNFLKRKHHGKETA